MMHMLQDTAAAIELRAAAVKRLAVVHTSLHTRLLANPVTVAIACDVVFTVHPHMPCYVGLLLITRHPKTFSQGFWFQLELCSRHSPLRCLVCHARGALQEHRAAGCWLPDRDQSRQKGETVSRLEHRLRLLGPEADCYRHGGHDGNKFVAANFIPCSYCACAQETHR